MPVNHVKLGIFHCSAADHMCWRCLCSKLLLSALTWTSLLLRSAEVWYEAIILIFLMFLMDTFKMNSIFSASHHSTEHTQHQSLQSLDPGVWCWLLSSHSIVKIFFWTLIKAVECSINNHSLQWSQHQCDLNQIKNLHQLIKVNITQFTSHARNNTTKKWREKDKCGWNVRSTVSLYSTLTWHSQITLFRSCLWRSSVLYNAQCHSYSLKHLLTDSSSSWSWSCNITNKVLTVHSRKHAGHRNYQTEEKYFSVKNILNVNHDHVCHQQSQAWLNILQEIIFTNVTF